MLGAEDPEDEDVSDAGKKKKNKKNKRKKKKAQEEAKPAVDLEASETLDQSVFKDSIRDAIEEEPERPSASEHTD